MGIDLEQPSGEHQEEDNRQNLIVSVVPSRDGISSEDHRAVNSCSISGTDTVNNGTNLGRRVSNGGYKVHPGDSVNLNTSSNLEPHDGMEFESKEEAFSFYKEYAKSIGFASIIKASRRSRLSGKFIDAKFVCTRYGNKRKSCTDEIPKLLCNVDAMTGTPVKKKRGRISQSLAKTDCKASMHVKQRQDGRWLLCSFIKEHNHEIFPDQSYFFQSHRNLDRGNSKVDGMHTIHERPNKMCVSMSKQAGGHKKVEKQRGAMINPLGHEKYLALEEGDLQVILDHFLDMQEENPNFFYAIDLNKEQRMRSVFWVDAKGRLDYGNFSDVVFFDTTYLKNEYKLPVAPFVGVNHHFQFLLFGCALLAEETISTYVWLMRAWHTAMGGQAPRVILSDQDNALKDAITKVFPDSRHCFCLWHILTKVPEKLSHVIRQHENFMTSFSKCIFRSSTKEKFEKRWQKMVDGFNLRDEKWLQSLYDDRSRWIPAYMGDLFLAGMSAAQRLDGMNPFFDKHIQRKTTLKELLDKYKIILKEKYEEEGRADSETWQKQPVLKSPSPFGKQMAALYTHAIFKKFQAEVLGVMVCHPRKDGEDGATVTFKVQDFKENQHFLVVWNEMVSSISCSCRLFEYNGFLCRHAMIALQMSGVHDIPSQYILKRWTKNAKCRELMGYSADVLESRAQRYNNLCQQAFKLGDEGSLSQESYSIAFKALEDALRKCERMNNSIQSIIQPSLPSAYDLHDFDEVNQIVNINGDIRKSSGCRKRKVHMEPDAVTIGMHDSWQQMARYSPRTPTLNGYFGGQQIVEGQQLTTIGTSQDKYYANQQNMQGLGQLKSIAPIHDSHYMAPQRLNVLGQLHFQPQTMQSCFDAEGSLENTDESNMGVESACMHGVASKRLHSKHLSQ